MRTLLVVASVAALVIVVFWLTDYGGAVSGGPLSPETTLDRPSPAAIEAAIAQAPSVPVHDGALGVRVAAPGGLQGRCADRGVVGAKLLRIVEKTHGQQIRTIDRSFAGDYYEILMAWHRDPSRKDEDIELLVDAWRKIDDPTFRWALSFLFEQAGDDRLVEPLAQLFGVDAWRMTDALANLGTKTAVGKLVDLLPSIPKPEVRSQARLRVARSGIEGAVDLLMKAASDAALTDSERMRAVESLGFVDNDPEAMTRAMDIAFGPASPVGDLGEQERDHPERDLRSAAVLAVMKRGDQDLTRRLLAAADLPGSDPALARIVDQHLCGYQGADLSQIVLGRAERRRTVSSGEAIYLNNACSRSDVDRLKGLLHHAASPAVRDILHGAILNAAKRE